MMRGRPGLLWVVLACGLEWSLLLFANAARGESLDAFRDKTLTYVVPGKPGGGYDRYARLVARHLPNYLPVARVVVRNSPGAGGLVSAHQLYHAKPDGLTIAAINSGILYAQILEHDGLRFDLRELAWIGKSASDFRVLVTGHDSEFLSLDDLYQTDREFLLGTGGAGGASYNESRMLRGILSLNTRLIPGFRGDNAKLAIRRGDIDGKLFSYATAKGFIDSGDGLIVLQVAGNGVFDTKIPRLRDLVTTEEQSIALEVIEAVTELGRLTAAPPDLPTELLASLRSAYIATLSDPEFLAEAHDLGLSISPALGEEVAQRLSALFTRAEPHRSSLQSLAGGSR